MMKCPPSTCGQLYMADMARLINLLKVPMSNAASHGPNTHHFEKAVDWLCELVSGDRSLLKIWDDALSPHLSKAERSKLSHDIMPMAFAQLQEGSCHLSNCLITYHCKAKQQDIWTCRRQVAG